MNKEKKLKILITIGFISLCVFEIVNYDNNDKNKIRESTYNRIELLNESIKSLETERTNLLKLSDKGIFMQDKLNSIRK